MPWIHSEESKLRLDNAGSSANTAGKSLQVVHLFLQAMTPLHGMNCVWVRTVGAFQT